MMRDEMSGPGATPACGLTVVLSRPSVRTVRNKVRSNARLLSVLPLAAIIGLSLAACATPEVQVVHQPIKQNVAVGQPCVDAKEIPAKPKSAMRKDGDTRQLAAGATIDIRNLDEYSDKLDSMLRACAKP